jgi:hypothetical protein
MGLRQWPINKRQKEKLFFDNFQLRIHHHKAPPMLIAFTVMKVNVKLMTSTWKTAEKDARETEESSFFLISPDISWKQSMKSRKVKSNYQRSLENSFTFTQACPGTG